MTLYGPGVSPLFRVEERKGQPHGRSARLRPVQRRDDPPAHERLESPNYVKCSQSGQSGPTSSQKELKKGIM